MIDKAIYAKMLDHVKKIINRAYLEDKPYNDIVRHLEREMQLNGLGALGALISLNSATAAAPEEKKRTITTRILFSLWQKWPLQGTKSKTQNKRYYEERTKNAETTRTMPINQNATRVEKCTKLKTARTVQMRQKTHDVRGANTPSSPI